MQKMKKSKSKAPKKTDVVKITAAGRAMIEPGRAPGAAFYPGQRITVTRVGSWARGHNGTVEVIEPGKVFVRLDSKQVSHSFAPADLAAL
jgi:hypothetical protein